MANQFQASTETTDAPIDGIDALLINDPLGTGCMACCSGGVDPTWGGVATVSAVKL